MKRHSLKQIQILDRFDKLSKQNKGWTVSSNKKKKFVPSNYNLFIIKSKVTEL